VRVARHTDLALLAVPAHTTWPSVQCRPAAVIASVHSEPKAVPSLPGKAHGLTCQLLHDVGCAMLLDSLVVLAVCFVRLSSPWSSALGSTAPVQQPWFTTGEHISLATKSVAHHYGTVHIG
jgi:hypothetical protein